VEKRRSIREGRVEGREERREGRSKGKGGLRRRR
jgi:hypothetical protein